jgi:hypothetical protein
VLTHASVAAHLDHRPFVFAAKPITIGLGVAQSGQLAANSKAALAVMKIQLKG